MFTLGGMAVGGHVLQNFRSLALTVYLNIRKLPGAMMFGWQVDPETERAEPLVGPEWLSIWTVIALMLTSWHCALVFAFIVGTSPAAACMAVKLLDRVLPARWYLATLGPVVLVAGAPEWLGWVYALVWAFAFRWRAGAFQSEQSFWFAAFDQNPNIVNRRAHNKAWQYFRAGQQSPAEDEFMRVLIQYPQNEKAKFYMRLLDGQRALNLKGYVGKGFTCMHCGFKEGRLLAAGQTMSKEEHGMFFFQICPSCGKYSDSTLIEMGVLE